MRVDQITPATRVMVVADSAWRLEPAVQNILLQWWLDHDRRAAQIMHLGGNETEMRLAGLLNGDVIPVHNLASPRRQKDPVKYELAQTVFADEAIILQTSLKGEPRTRLLVHQFVKRRIPLRIYTEQIK